MRDLKLFLIFVVIAVSQCNSIRSSSSSVGGTDNGKSSLVFVFDTTGSMYNDLRQLIEGAEMILKTALEESDIIEDFVFVPFHDPAVGPATVTKDKNVFKAALNRVRVYGGGDCPEKSLGGIQLALNVSRPKSYVYVFTDATASDHRLVGKVLDLIQRKQSQVVFVLTGHCNDLHKINFKVYTQIAAASSGQVFNLDKTNVHKVLEFVKSSIKARTVNLGSIIHPAGYNYTHEIPVDKTLSEVTVSVAGAKPHLKVVNPEGKQLTGPPKLVTTLDLSEIIVVKVLEPEPGNWSITVGSTQDYSVKVVGLSNLTFQHGFSVEKPHSMAETSYRPLQGTYNYMMVSLTGTDKEVSIKYAEILSLAGKPLFEVPLKLVDKKNKIYLADAFVPPDDFFYISINGRDDHDQELKRMGATAVQAKPADVPYLTAPKKVEARLHERVTLTCGAESMVPLSLMWTKDSAGIQRQKSTLQSTRIEYVIPDMSEQHVGTYRCVANNIAGLASTATELTLIVDPPQVSIYPQNASAIIGEDIIISCTVYSEALILKTQLFMNGTHKLYSRYTHVEPDVDGFYTFNKTIHDVKDKDGGVYTCIAANRGGQSEQSTHLSILTQPRARILGPHTLYKPRHSTVKIVCQVDNAEEVTWMAPNRSLIVEAVNGTHNAVLGVKDLSEDGMWTCIAKRGSYRATDAVHLNVLIKPEVLIEGPNNITIVNGTVHQIVCKITAKPTPRILWHRETDKFLNNVVTLVAPNVYKSVLTLDTKKDAVEGTYFCFGENSEGIHQDSVTVNVRRKMTLLMNFTDKSVEIYSQIELHCVVDGYPIPRIQWYHNGTELTPSDKIQISDDKTTVYVVKVDFDSVGSYACIADNGYEKIEVNGTLSVYGLEPPVLSKERQKLVTQRGKPANITCSIIKGSPDPTITWQYKANTTDIFTDLPDDAIITEDRLQVDISMVNIDHAGTYRCIADNIIGVDTYDLALIVQYPPKLEVAQDAEDKPQEVTIGEEVKLSCKAEGIPPPIIVWTKNSKPVIYSDNVVLSSGNELTIKKATDYDSGLYVCNATSVLGSSQKNFSLVVYDLPKISPPGIEFEVEVVEGQLVELPCKVDGLPKPTVEWYQNGELLAQEKMYIDENGLRFVANLSDFGEYSCNATNKYGNTSIAYTLLVWVPPYIEGPLETSQQVTAGSNVTLQCDAVGFPLPNVLWQFQNVPIEQNTTDLSFNELGSLFIVNASSNHEGLYTCVAENVADVAMKFIYLAVNEAPTIQEDSYTGPYVASDKDTSLVISCRATGKPKPYVTWYKDDMQLDKDSRYTISPDGSLTVHNPSQDMSGVYTCLANSTVGLANKTVPVHIYSLPKNIQSEESRAQVTLLEGSNDSVACPVRAANTDKVKWYKDAKLIGTGTLQFPNVSRTDASTYSCVVSNAVGSAHAAVDVEVEWRPQLRDSGATNVEIVRGYDGYLHCAFDAKPQAKIKWLFDSQPLVGEEQEKLKLINVQPQQAGSYKCVANNIHGTVTKEYHLEVLVPPFISDFDLLDVQLKEGTNATLECNAKGSPPPNITWTYNNTSAYIANTTLILKAITPSTSGLYHCSAQNKAGKAHIVYRVDVVSPAKVRDIVAYVNGEGHTVDGRVEVVLGSHTRISCEASGSPLPRIQWVRNGQVLAQNQDDVAYADLILDVKATHAGVYSCFVTNEGGADERKLRVDVLEPPKIFQTLFGNTPTKEVKLSIVSGQTFYLHCHPYGNPIPDVFWFKDGLPLRLFDDSMVTRDYGEVVVANTAKYEHSGNYTCVARNKVGNTSVVYLVDVLVPPPTPKESSVPTTRRVGSLLQLECPAAGSPPPRVTWVQHPYTEIQGDTPRVTLLNDGYTLQINSTEVSDSGKYSCIMSNIAGTSEVIFDVTIEKPPSIAGDVGDGVPEKHVLALKRSIVFKCEADGHPLPKITWLKDTQQLKGSTSNIQVVVGSSLLGVRGASVREAGQYLCVAENTAGTAYRRFNLVLQVPGKWSSWSAWSLCDVTCGLGSQRRDRYCHYLDDYNNTIDRSTESDKVILDESACKGLATEKRKCHMPPCEWEETAGRWSMWSRWSACSGSCGAATQARTRRCRTKARCVGDNVQIRKCTDLPKCENTHDQNEVFNSAEEIAEYNPYMPEATFEFQPEVVNSHQRSVDVEEFYTKRESKPSQIYYDVKVTENLDHSDRGRCDFGFRHNITYDTCDDIDECVYSTNQCHSTQVCVNTAGAYKCTCPPGYVALGAGQRCLDINECEQEISGCEFACVNVAGGYVCACPRHLRLHMDLHHCVTPSAYNKPFSYERSGNDDYLSTAFDYPSRYTRFRS